MLTRDEIWCADSDFLFSSTTGVIMWYSDLHMEVCRFCVDQHLSDSLKVFGPASRRCWALVTA